MENSIATTFVFCPALSLSSSSPSHPLFPHPTGFDVLRDLDLGPFPSVPEARREPSGLRWTDTCRLCVHESTGLRKTPAHQPNSCTNLCPFAEWTQEFLQNS